MGRFLELLKREVWPSAWPAPATEGTEATISPMVEAFWAETYSNVPASISPVIAERVWVVNRCIQLNAQQIASMPLRFVGTTEPAWVSSPDPNWFPNGIGDAVFAVVRAVYGWGFAILLVTSRYANGLPSGWTVLDSQYVTIGLERGRRTYHYSIDGSSRELDPLDVVQIDRNPSNALHGTSAIRAYASQCWGLLCAGELTRSTMTGGIPTSVLKSSRKLTQAQAEAMQAQWVARTSSRGGAPAVLPPEVEFETLSFSPKDLMLLEAQEFEARVIASAFGVPPFMINLPLEGGLTYQNPAMLGEFWWRFELRPRAKQIADALTAQMLPRGNYVVFDASDTFAPLVAPGSVQDDPQLSAPPESQVAGASPADQPGEVRPIRPMEVTL
jgi:HK97 family phage portal protein